MRTVYWTIGLAALASVTAALSACTDEAYCYTCGQQSDPVQTSDGGDTDSSVSDVQDEQLECPAGFANCNGIAIDGCETNVRLDKLNCGECGNACSLANAESSCKDGSCAINACASGFHDCNEEADDGCESEVAKDPLNCGQCGNSCEPFPNAISVCRLGKCDGFTCESGFADCNGDPSDGCEVNLLTDGNNCGACEHVCDAMPHADRGCSNGVCSVGTCDTGYADCDGSVWSGCETILASDVNHCGACNNACPDMPNGAASCVDSQCAVGGCNPGYADCDRLPNGCEAYLATDVLHCGACNNPCPDVANGIKGCSHFQCGIADCNAGYGDCFGGAIDGCETDLHNDPDHCGTCDTQCAPVAHGTRACAQGKCLIGSCDPNFEDCNNDISDGCEKNLLDDVLNCGACNQPCPIYPHASSACMEGQCGIGECFQGFSNCDNDLANGCERNTSNDPFNCGGCGVVCGSGSCQNSRCVCLTNVLVIADDSPSGTAILASALEAAGLTVTQTTVPSYQYDGTNPPLSGFGSVVVLAGGPGTASYSTDMPAAGQQAIVDFVLAGNGLVLTEWAAHQVAGARWQTLEPLVLLTRTVAFPGQVTYSVDPAFASHPLWQNLPPSFTFASTSNVGQVRVGEGIRRVASSPEALDALAIRDLPSVGRVVHVAHAGNYAPNGWTNPNIQTLIANAALWSARCN